MSLMNLELTTERVEAAKEKIKKQYLAEDNNLPWLIGYSGGKDSTCTAQLVFKSLLELKATGNPLKRKVVVFSSDTMIENPLVKAIIQKNIALINSKAKSESLPIEAVILRPDITKTYWVNIIGRGYPCPNTMFRWCTDRLKIEPANTFVKRFIDKNGETIMVLGVRQGESQTRDRVLEKHGVKGETLMRHTTLTNAYVFPPIKDLSTVDVFTYLSEFPSPWGSSNKELFFFYEESGGGDCPIFLSDNEMTSKNSCGNSRLGCWICTVVSQDKSLSGFINTGFHDYLKPLLDFRNWLSSIRDKDEYRCRFRANGSMYLIQLALKKASDTGKQVLQIPNKGSHNATEVLIEDDGTLPPDSGFILVEEQKVSAYMKANNLTPKSKEMAKLIIYNPVTGVYSRLGTGPFTYEARVEILKKLLETEKEYLKQSGQVEYLLSDAEIIEIIKIWNKNGDATEPINELLAKYGRKPVVLVKDESEIWNEKYKSDLKKLAKKNHADFDLIMKIFQIEKDHLCEDQRSSAQQEIISAVNSDRFNY